MHSLLPSIAVLAATVGLAAAENKMPVFHARAEAPRLTREYAELTNNTEILFEWHEARMQQHLWKAATRGAEPDDGKNPRRLGRRADLPDLTVPRSIGAPLGRGDCAGCAKLMNDDLEYDIFKINWQYMQQKMIQSLRMQLNNKCVFYTGLPPIEKDAIFDKLGKKVEGQSEIATEWACKTGRISIWNLWPGKNKVDTGSSTDAGQQNFWEIEESQSWLYRLSEANTDGVLDDPNQNPKRDYVAYRAHYFRAMSDAVAHSCSGTVFVMAGNEKQDMSVYIGIWVDTEYPTIQQLHSLGVVTELILVDTLDHSRQWELDFSSPAPKVVKQITPRDVTHIDFDLDLTNLTEAERHHHIQKRSSCTENIAYEKASGGDWLGRGY